MHLIAKFLLAEGDILLVVFIVCVLAAIVGSWIRRTGLQRGAIDVSDYYSVRASILSPAERSFAGVLNMVAPARTKICYKVRLGDIFTTRRGLAGAVRKGAWNRINQKHIDFLLVSSETFAPLAAIELDDDSHEAKERADRDRFVDAVFKASGVSVLRFRAAAAYSPNEVRGRIEAELGTHHQIQTADPREHTDLEILNATNSNLKTPKNA